MATGIQILGLESTSKFLKEKGKEAMVLADKAITQATFFMEEEVKQSIAGHRAEPKSVDTGRFLGSVKSDKAGFLQGKVESDVSYAKHLEYGTSRMPARAHFRNSASRNTHKVQAFVAAEVAKI